METPKLKVKYSIARGESFSMLLAKLANTATTNARACHIKKIMKGLEKLHKQIMEEFKKDILEAYAVKKEDGSGIKYKDEMESDFDLLEGKEKEYQEALKTFGEREGTIEWRPLTPDALADIKLSARELDLLGELFSEENGPGVPHLHSM